MFKKISFFINKASYCKNKKNTSKDIQVGNLWLKTNYSVTEGNQPLEICYWK